MNADATSEHIPAAELLEYFERRLPEKKQKEIEEHLADCTDCAALARKTRDFVEVWHGWTARSHAAAKQKRPSRPRRH